MWGRLYQEPAQGALAKLENVLPDDQRGEIAWARRSLVAMGLLPLLEVIRRGTRRQQRLQMTYQGGTGPGTTERAVDPYALVFRSGWWYLVGYCHLRQGMRTFRVDRIRDIALRAEPFHRPADFDVQAYLDGMFADQAVVQATLHFVPEAAHIALANLADWDSYQENPDGSIEVTLSAPDLYWLASTVLGFSTLVEVLDPPDLRALVRQWALGTAALYQDEI